MIRRHLLPITMLLGFAVPAHGTSLGECQKAHKSSTSNCQDAATQAKGLIDQASQNAKQATSGSDGTGHSNMGGQLSGASTAATNAVTTAKGTCTDEQKKCDDACDASKAQKKEEKPKISDEKKACDKEIKDITDQLDASAGQSKNGTDGGDKTKDAAQGSGGSPPGGGDKDKDKSDDSKTPDTSTPATSDTSSTGSSSAALTPANAGTATTGGAGSCPGTDRDYLDENCVGELTARCKGNSSDSQCQLFNQRYCTGNGGSGGGASSGVLGTSGATLNQGSGLSASDGYCAGQNASAFCNANTSQCPSCCKQNNSCGGTVTQDCSADPSRILTSPSAVSTASIGGGSSGAGGGGASLSGSSDASIDGAGKANAKPESDEAKLLGKMSTAPATGGGGGGGGGGGAADAPSSSGAVSDFLAGYGINLDRKPAAAAEGSDAPVLAASVKDIMPDRRSDVFKIQSLVLKARCDADLELNCPPKN